MAHLIDKDALVAEIEKLKERFSAFHHRDGNDWPLDNYGKMRAYNEVLSSLDTLEVKEVDLEKEVDEMWNYVFSELGWDGNTQMAITHKEFMALAKHFYELGLKVKQG